MSTVATYVHLALLFGGVIAALAIPTAIYDALTGGIE